MTDDLSPLIDVLDAWSLNQTPAMRRKLARKMGQALRKRQQKNIAANVDPDGQPMPKRKKRPRGSIANRGKMFKALRQLRNLRLKTSDTEIEIGFPPGKVSDIASIHHFGLEGAVDKEGRIRTRYPVRRLLGFSQQAEDEIMDALAGMFP
ncbi:hypothetical protein ABAC460_10250 [Asticcacaulis sp. AC460]|uniref:phage virion morphogenesis protein n=1 Tax=Asticcacaulis sp. AC460 TaxID=1282360 RepID=UPI0003C3AE21|nr:phage virion morphogenesis protein [Asticcacaulis sp. AC460]ESQ90129.1 hypothetical protein ABAC460_10250 [Asticcacaulis sp. AC460]